MTEANQVWVIDDDRSIRWVLEKALTKAGMQVTSFSSANGVMEALERNQPEVIVSDVRMPGMDGFALMEKIKASYPELPVIIMTAHSDLDSAVSAYHSGAFEYLPKPFDVDEVTSLVQRALDVRLQQQVEVADFRVFHQFLPQCRRQFGDAFEEKLISQATARTLEDSMAIGWEILGLLAETELTRLSNEQIIRYIRREKARA